MATGVSQLQWQWQWQSCLVEWGRAQFCEALAEGAGHCAEARVVGVPQAQHRDADALQLALFLRASPARRSNEEVSWCWGAAELHVADMIAKHRSRMRNC